MNESLHGTVNHVAITVSDLGRALAFFRPFLEHFGYVIGEPASYADTRVAVNVHRSNGIAINLWEAKMAHAFEVYEPGLHHLALNAGSRAAVDDAHRIAVALGAEILDGPGKFPFAEAGYYAFYCAGPDRLKLEVVYMTELDRA